ncbi:hypothetical protein [Enterovibrio norvegicus]|uniref:hypothetical protein n=1 Tax=Enterovibrio norvegicus TaxID=188144 RepID=UPI0013D8BAAD|nr:hypothetical protein [Enterovibrio norvegicus]
MMVLRYTILAAILTFVVLGAYIYQFHYQLGYQLSDKASDWVDFSDYIGGLLGPALSFLSLVMLVKSLSLQNEANMQLKREAEENVKNEKMRAFETYFFSMLESQRNAFERFSVDYGDSNSLETFRGVEGVHKLEDIIEDMRDSGKTDGDIAIVLSELDEKEKIYNTIRIFYNVVKMISERLCEKSGFEKNDRKVQLQTLINFTEFSLLRLVVICMQFSADPPARYLMENDEFIEVLTELGMPINQY